MKKVILLVAAAFVYTGSFAQKVEYEEAQTRIIEPLQDVYVRPMVADIKMIKTERQEYKFQHAFLPYKKLADMTASDLENARALATYEAARKEGADVIIGATFYLKQHEENGKISEFGVDVTVNGYPAQYVNWHKVGDEPKDKEWVTNLINGQIARNRANSEQKSEAVKGH